MPRTKGAKDKEPRKKKLVPSNHFFATFQKFVRDELYAYLDKDETISAFVICNETGWGEHEHSHAYIETKEPTLLETLREFLLLNDFDLGDLQSCKSSRSTIKYCSKEDLDIRIKNVDREHLHINWKLGHASKLKTLSEDLYVVRAIPPNYRIKLHDLHDVVWRERFCDLDKMNALEHASFNSQTLCDILNSPKKGIWIYGETGTGKTSAVMTCVDSPFCRFLGDCTRFPLNNYNGEKDIVYEECAEKGYEKHRELILQLTGGFCAVSDRKNNTHFTIKMEGKLYITSNFQPPTESEFLRRFAIFHFF
jgi:hypothetical protein